MIESFYEVYKNAKLITPDDDNDMEISTGKALISRGIMLVGTTPDLEIFDEAGNAVTIQGLATGVIHPIRTRRILEGTDATSVFVFW